MRRKGQPPHLLSEWAREENKSCSKFIGREIEQDGFTFTVDSEMANATQEFVEYCEQYPGEAFC